MERIKFVWNGIKANGKLHRTFYSDGALINSPKGTLTIYARDYKSLPKIDGLTAENGTDIQTDYFESDRIRVTPDNRHYPAVLAALKQRQEHDAKKWAKSKYA